MPQFNEPRTAILKTGSYSKGPGKIITMDSTNNTVDLAAVSEVALGVTAGDSTRDAAGALQTAAGATVSYYPMGGVLMIQSAASQTYTLGCLVYATNSGLATASSGSSAKVIGTFAGTADGSAAGATTALVANGNSDTDGALLSEGNMIAVNTNTAVSA
tara:strand:- start:55 stop:531 length:477 start_codon:yes stop_codon:yes gene_type:complete